MTRGKHVEVLTIPMFIKRVMFCITTRKPTHDESESYDHFYLTYESLEFDPHCSSYDVQ
jgi:hypothetical protein